MESINNFDVNVYSEELHQVSESEHDEVMSLMADDEQEWKGYSDWSQAVESAAWTGAQVFNGVTVKKQCEHKDCSHFRCEKNLRLGGIEI
jgi:hypothetical protein